MRRRRAGVRTRVQISFAVGGLVVSVFLAGVSWSLATTYLQDQRELTATRNALVGADLLARRLASGQGVRAADLRDAASLGNDAFHLPPGPGPPVSATPRVQAQVLPDELLALAASGTAAQQRLRLDDRPLLAVALPLPDGGTYVELFAMTALDRALRTLSTVLAATAVLATVLAAALGRWAADRTLRPLRSLITAAGAVVGGQLDRRLEADGDPDLSPLAAAFNTTTASLQERITRDARFAGDVGHELRSPVTTMINAVEVLRNRQQELSPPGREALDLLSAEVTRFRTLVEDLLEVSRDDVQTEVTLVPLRLAPLVRRVADRCVGREVTVVVPGAEQVLVDADPRRLERVVGNLVDNAERHGGGVRDVCVQRVPHAVRVVVQDRGPGVPEGDRERVFERFYRGRASRAQTSGSGLGLALAKHHATVQGGRLWVEDGVPEGAAFVLELPLAREVR